MGYLSRMLGGLRHYVKRYPRTLAVRTVAAIFFAGYFYIFPRATIAAAFLAGLAILSYLAIKICQFFKHEMSGFERFALPYQVFALLWNLLSWPSEVDEI